MPDRVPIWVPDRVPIEAHEVRPMGAHVVTTKTKKRNLLNVGTPSGAGNFG